MRIAKFWVVTKPRPESEHGDICFETDTKGLALQLKGGLEEGDIHALYTAQDEAEKEAGRILAAYKKYLAALQGAVRP